MRGLKVRRFIWELFWACLFTAYVLSQVCGCASADVNVEYGVCEVRLETGGEPLEEAAAACNRLTHQRDYTGVRCRVSWAEAAHWFGEDDTYFVRCFPPPTER